MKTLRDLRKQCNMTAAQVAKVLGVTRNAIVNYESGQRRISLEQVLSLAKLFGVTTDEIILAQLNSISIRNTK